MLAFTDPYSPVQEQNRRFCPYAGEYGSVKTLILAYCLRWLLILFVYYLQILNLQVTAMAQDSMETNVQPAIIRIGKKVHPSPLSLAPRLHYVFFNKQTNTVLQQTNTYYFVYVNFSNVFICCLVIQKLNLICFTRGGCTLRNEHI